MVGNDAMTISEHLEEFRHRLYFCFGTAIFSCIACFLRMKEIVVALQAPAIGVRFFQFSPGEYLFVSIKTALFCGILISIPLILYQILLYLLPGLTKNERDIVLVLSSGSVILFLFGLVFSYFLLIPIALKFFIFYGSGVVEPFWSFDRYFDFVAVLLFTTGIAFQVPVIQVGLGLLGIVTGQDMLRASKYAVVICTAFAAIITPSTDPATQVLLSVALLSLYLGGSVFLITFKK